jgi:hypothetical protein
MSVKQLMEECYPVIPGDEKWETTVEFVIENDAFVMAALIEDAKTIGFREPVSIYRYPEDNYAVVTDGTHRVVAAFLAGIETLEVEDTTNAARVARKIDPTTTPTLVTEVVMNDDFSGDADDLGMVVRSFPLGESDWVSAYDREEIANGHIEVTWDRVVDFEETDSSKIVSLIESITRVARERVEAIYGAETVESVTSFLRY